jgi:predicted  nucleic acid-binding Zn-ribbon protein
MQSTLEARADELLGRDAARATATMALEEEISSLQTQLEKSEQDQIGLRARLSERDSELDTFLRTARQIADSSKEEEKQIEVLRTEMVSIEIDRDHLIDQLAVTSGRLVQSEGRNEKLEASLRAARGALTPLPEGERALRSEVIGLRGRIEEASEEYQSLAAELSKSSTELAIARARVEDRQHEVNCHVERIEEIDEKLERNEEQLSTIIGKHREILALSTRLQADNNELRSAQAALEETLQAAGGFLDHINESLISGALLLFVDRIASGPIQLSASACTRVALEGISTCALKKPIDWPAFIRGSAKAWFRSAVKERVVRPEFSRISCPTEIALRHADSWHPRLDRESPFRSRRTATLCPGGNVDHRGQAKPGHSDRRWCRRRRSRESLALA